MRIARGWYETDEVAPDLVRISQPHVDPLLAASLWWLRGTDRDVVVDAGLGIVRLRSELASMFERDPLLIITHAHLDHVGAAHEFRERAAHHLEAAALGAGVPASLDGPQLFRLLGLDPGGTSVPGLLIDALPYASYDPATYRIDPLSVDTALDEASRIDLGGRTLTVLHLPGHTPGSIALLEEHTGVLYTGDVVYEGQLIDDLPESDVTAYQRSMRRLAGLECSVVHPGHGPSFDQTRLRKLATAYLHRRPSDPGCHPAPLTGSAGGIAAGGNATWCWRPPRLPSLWSPAS